MIISMTGYGRGETSANGVTVTVELRSVNNRFLEISTRMPRELNARENEMREMVRRTLSRGKVHLNVSIDKQSEANSSISVNAELVGVYKEALEQIRKHAKIKESVTLSNLLHFSDEIMGRASEEATDHWDLVSKALETAVAGIDSMRRNEGNELARDIRDRIHAIDAMVDQVEQTANTRIPQERQRLRDRIAQLFEHDEIDEQRLEFEIVMLADKLDITEECVRYRSHSKYFIEAVDGPEPAGRKLGFLLQEINREVTTMGSKANEAEIAHLVVRAKEELEKIREQVQNIE